MLNIILKFMLSIYPGQLELLSLNYDCNITVVGASFDVQCTQNIYKLFFCKLI